MERLNIARCRELIVQPAGEPLADEEVVQLRDRLYSLGDVIADAFVDLGNIDQTTFQPPGNAVDFFERGIAELIEHTHDEEVQ